MSRKMFVFVTVVLSLLLTVAVYAALTGYKGSKTTTMVTAINGAANASSFVSDTIAITTDDRVSDYRSLEWVVRIPASTQTATGQGNVDSVWVYLKTKVDTVYYGIDSVLATSNNGIPFACVKSLQGNDTTIRSGGLFLIYRIADSVSQVVQSAPYVVTYTVNLQK